MSFAELENWNPMEEDFRRGNSKFKDRQCHSSDLDELCLYVKNIPTSITQDTFFKLMSEGGRSVTKVMINKKIYPNSTVTYGFVNFSNPKDCGNALSAYHGKPPYHFQMNFAKKRKDTEYKDSNTDNREIMNNSISPNHPYSNNDSFHIGGANAVPNGVTNVNDRNETPSLGGGKGRGMRIDLGGLKSISQIKIVTGGSGRTVMLESPEKPECEQDNTSDLKSPQPGVIQNKRTEIGAPELVSNPFYFCFYCKKEARFACGYCRKPFCSRNCQIVDWPSHQYLCKVAKGVSESLLESYKSSYVPATDSSYMSESSSDCEKSLDPECSVVKTKRQSNETQPRRRLESSVNSPTENTFSVRRMPLSTKVSEKPLEHMPLKVGDVEKVSIINIESPSKFWIQLHKFSSILLNLEKQLSSIQKIDISTVRSDMFCCTQLNNKVCRGKIIKERSPHEVLVYLVDYGETLTVSKNHLFQLPEESRKYPMQAVCCKLVDTQTGDTEWNSEDLDSFQLHTANKQYKAVVLKCNSEINEVSLVNEDGISLYSILALGRSTNSCMDDLSPSFESDGSPPSIWSKLKPGSCLTLVPSIVIENTIWCYLFVDKDTEVHDIVEIEKLLQNYSSEDVTLCAEEGDFAAGFSPEYQQFYRCVILKRNRGGFLVRYIDYGNEEEITRLNALSPELFLKFSYLVKCEIPASLSADDFAAPAEVLVVKVEKNVAELSINLGKKHSLKCYPCYPTCFNEVPETMAVKCSTPVKEISHSPKPVDPKIHAEKVMKPKMLSLNTKYNVKVVFIKTVSEVFVQLNEEEKGMNAMFLEFNKYCNSVNSCYVPHIGEIVCCKFSDGAWYRGQVQEKANDKYRVFFVDYGNEDIVFPKDIQHLPEKFICPKYSVCVSFSGIKTEHVSQRLLDQLLKENWDMKIIDDKKSPLEVMLFLKDTSLTDFVERENSLKRNKSLLKLKKLPAGMPVDVKITHEENGILHLHQVEDIKSLEDMCNQINSLKSTQVPKKIFVNNVYCGLFTDGLWYRVTVVEETLPNAYKVQFLDYGNIESVSINDLRELPDNVFTLPIYCIPVVVQNRNKYSDLNLEDQYSVEVVDNKENIQEIKILNVPEAVNLPNISSLKKQQLNDGLNEVLICHAEDNVHYCQLSTDNDEVLDLFKKLQKLSRGDSPKILNEGDVISAQSSDGFWYRASVVSVKKAPSYKVLFFDYGNAESVTFDCVKILPEELLKHPIFAIPMKIQNIADVKDPDTFTTHVPVKKIKTSDDNVHIVEIVLKKDVNLPKFSALQKKTLPSGTSKITLCHVEGSIFYVNLSSDENIVEKLICNLLEASKFDNLPGIPEVGDIICAKFTDNVWYRSSVQEVFAESLKVSFFDYGNSETVTLENTKVLPSELCSYPIFSVPTKFNDLEALEKMLLQDLDTFDVKVVGMDGDVQVVDVVLINDVDNVSKIVYSPVYLSSLKSSSLPLNETCKMIFKNANDNLYFAVKSSDCDEMKKLNSILQNANTEAISHVPSMNEVLLIKRSDKLWHRGCITKSNSNESVYFIDLGMTEDVDKTSMYCLPENCTSFPVFVIKALVETDEPVVFEKDYYSQNLNQNGDGTFTIKVYHQHMVSAVDKQELPLNEERSVVFFHKENDLLYLQVADVSTVEVLAQVQTALTQCSSLLSIPYKPAVGELLCAKSQLDNAWYRGCVEDVVSADKYKIRFIDYGNCEEVSVQHLQYIPSMLIKFPSLCIPVKFIDNTVSDSIELEKLYNVMSESKDSNNIQIIQLVVAEDVKIVEVVASENKISSIVNEIKKFKYTQCTFVPFSAAGEQDIVIYSVDEGFSVFCAPYNQDNISANIQLPSELTEYCTNKGKPFENGCEPELDDIVLAKFSEDGQWYRAAIVDKVHPLYDVNFVDYGNSEQLDISQLRKMEEQFMALDVQANLCSLTGFTASNKNLPEIYKELKNFTIFSCQDPLKAEVQVKGEDIFISIPRITAHLVEKNLVMISNQN